MGCGDSKAATAASPSPSQPAGSHKAAGGGSDGRDPDAGKKLPFALAYELKEKLGRGQFAVVHRAVNKKNGTECAVKCITKASLTPEDLAALTVEVKAMEMLTGHPNFVAFYDFYSEKEHFFLCMELITGGELFDRICEKEKYTEREARDLLRQLAYGIQFAHGRGIAHRDLKPENILLKSRTDDTNIKLADLGFAKLITAAAPMMTTPCGTPGYVAPEILSGKPYTAQVDIWSLGVIFYILLCGYPPFASENDDQRELFTQIREGRFSFDPAEWGPISDQAKDLIRHILVVDPIKRYTAEQIMNHPWMKMDAAQLPDQMLGGTIVALKKYNARRKLKGAMNTVRTTVRMKMLTAASSGAGRGTPSAASLVLAGAREAAAAEDATRPAEATG